MDILKPILDFNKEEGTIKISGRSVEANVDYEKV